MKTLITNTKLIDLSNGRIQNDTWVLIEDSRIGAIGAGMDRPGAEECFDAGGLYLLPGMINLHVHIQRRHLHYRGQGIFRQGATAIENSPDTRRIILAVKNGWDEILHGVTTIRDCCSKNRINNELRDYIREGLIGGPRVVSCGFGIAGTGGHETHRYPGAVEVDGPDNVRRAVRTEIKHGADFIKFMGSGGLGGLPEHEHPYWVEFSPAEFKVGIEEAHNRMKKCTVHAMGTMSVFNAVSNGIDGIEHGTNLNDELVDMMRERGIYYVPTMSGIAAVADREAEGGSRELAEFIRELVVYPHRESVEKAYRAGILIGAGTDTLGDMVRELEMFFECGMSNLDCIRTATVNAALILGLEKEIGSVAKGLCADLLLVRDNPLENISHLSRIEKVMKNGEWVTPQGLGRL